MIVTRKAKNKSPKKLPQASSTGTLYVVATPIGNLEDITLRAIRVLGEVSLVAAEDTRHTRKLLTHFDIHTPLISYYKDKEVARTKKIIAHLEAGEDVALVSDAGTPGISDPGSILVKEVQTLGLEIVPVPGPSALSTAVSVSGFEKKPFLFLGFLPSRASHRRKMLESLIHETSHIIFYEAPHRIKKCLEDCMQILSDRNALVARELTKIHEEIISNTISTCLAALASKEKIKGEFVVMIEGAAAEEESSSDDIGEMLCWIHDNSNLSLRDAVQRVTKELGKGRSDVYKEALKIWGVSE